MAETKDVTQYQEQYSEKGLFDKIVDVARKAGLKVIYAVLLAYYVVESDSVPSDEKMKIYGALGYFILPVDLIPDFLPGGYADDLTALVWALTAVASNITPEIRHKALTKLHEWFGDYDPNEVANLV